jgi:hypothetical protein
MDDQPAPTAAPTIEQLTQALRALATYCSRLESRISALEAVIIAAQASKLAGGVSACAPPPAKPAAAVGNGVVAASGFGIDANLERRLARLEPKPPRRQPQGPPTS